MTKPAPPPSREEAATVVEIDAIDVAEWEHDQHTPLAPSAGLAALVRQTLPQPSTAEPRGEPVPPKQGRVAPLPSAATPTLAPAAPRVPRLPTTKPPVVLLAHDLQPTQPAGEPLDSTPRPSAAPAAPAVPAVNDARATALAVARRIAAQARSAPPLAGNTRSTPQAGIRRIAAQVRSAPPRVSPAPPQPPSPEAPPEALANPLPMPATESAPAPLASPSPMPAPESAPAPRASPLRVPPPEPPTPLASLSAMPPPPLHSEASHRVTTESDTAPVPQPLGRAASNPSLDRSTSAMIRSWFASRRGIVIAGATIAVLVLVIAVAATHGSDPGARSPMSARSTTSATSAAATTSAQNGTPAPRPARDPVGPAPSTIHDMPPAGASAPPAQTLRETPEEPSAATKPSPRATPPAPGSHGTAKTAAVQPAKHDAPVETEDGEPATARARAAYNAGNQALFDGKSDAAILAYRQALSAAPTFAPGFRGLGLAFAQRGDSGSAVMALRVYLNMAPHAKDAPLIKQRIADLLSH